MKKQTLPKYVTRSGLKAIDRSKPLEEAITTIDGTPPTPKQLAVALRYHTRQPHISETHHNKAQARFDALLTELGYRLLSKEYMRSYNSHSFECPKGHKFKMSPHRLFAGSRCKTCACIAGQANRDPATRVPRAIVRGVASNQFPTFRADIDLIDKFRTQCEARQRTIAEGARDAIALWVSAKVQ
jgi:hypothetical protein